MVAQTGVYAVLRRVFHRFEYPPLVAIMGGFSLC